ncbi:MAG: hypothetical protein M1818_001804 [Claussenomyces sp. TS43310]|nr:MAG: hypothetical protein M1818_001804 [Claussenomyces sp. TS43310]
MSAVATPAGIDHDYNFISSIERGIERSERLIVEDKGLVTRHELLPDRDRPFRGIGRYGRRIPWVGHDPHQPLGKAIQRIGVVVDKAPKGMKRNEDNNTNWSKNEKSINWAIEWIQEDGQAIVGKGMDKHSIGRIYARLLDQERTRAMSLAEKKLEKKRRREDTEGERARKRLKLEEADSQAFGQINFLQNPRSSAWNVDTRELDVVEDVQSDVRTFSENLDIHQRVCKLHFYLQRPYTPASQPKVLIPLPPLDTLSTLLRGRVLQEFPTIYVLSSPPETLPAEFMLEDHYLTHGKRYFATRPSAKVKEVDLTGGEEVDDTEDESEDGTSSETSSSETSSFDHSNSEMEEGEIL